jgi:multicomponent Na+:H+ antiporter subunit E
MTRLVNVFLLTVLWAGLFATTDWRSLVFGAFVAWLILEGTSRLFRDPSAPLQPKVDLRPLGMLLLAVAFVRELFLSAFAVTKEAWRPKLAIAPGIVAIPITVESDIEVTVLASLISLTPGTLSMEVTPDKKTLFVHALTVQGDGESLRSSIRDRLEAPVKRAFRTERR